MQAKSLSYENAHADGAHVNVAVERYLHNVDTILQRSQPILPENPFDLASLVFANQASQHSLSSSQLAQLIQERRAMADIHKANIKFRLDDLVSARSIAKMLDPADSSGRLGNAERQILDLDKQERDLQTALWKDTLELRTKLLEERSQYHATLRRTHMMQGGPGYEMQLTMATPPGSESCAANSNPS